MTDETTTTPTYPAVTESGVPMARLAMLTRPTPESEIKQRDLKTKSGTVLGKLDYVDARYVAQALDEACLPAFWQDDYRLVNPEDSVNSGVICRLGILVYGVGWVWKEDVGTASDIEPEKGAFSDAFKRAAVKWGIARDLYDTRDEAMEQSRGAGHRSQPSAQGAAPAPVRGRTANASGGGAKSRPFPVDPNDAPWVCPVHAQVVAFPAGHSDRTGNDYDAFYACPEGRNCSQRPPRGMKVLPHHLMAAPQVAQVVADDDSDLPF